MTQNIRNYFWYLPRKINEHFFSQSFYAGSHDLVPLTLLENEADAGAISSIQFNSLIKSGKIKKEDLSHYLEVGRYP